jgi:hypothetical protein
VLLFATGVAAAAFPRQFFFISDVTGFGVGLWPCSLRQDYLDLCTPEHTSGFFDPTVVSN